MLSLKILQVLDDQLNLQQLGDHIIAVKYQNELQMLNDDLYHLRFLELVCILNLVFDPNIRECFHVFVRMKLYHYRTR